MSILKAKQANSRTKLGGSRLLTPVVALALAMTLASCKQRESKAAEKAAEPAGAPASSANVVQKTFTSPAAAGSALFEAAKAGDQNALMGIFGADGKDILYSGDEVRDKLIRERFVAAYNQMNRWAKNDAGKEILYIGADNLSFPVPLQQNASGQWVFDTAAGKDEILARRIGNGELTAIGVLSEVANAQRQYFLLNHHYAGKFISDEGQHNGLYWPVAEGQLPSPLGRLADVAKDLGYMASDKPQPFMGYYYKILTSQSGEAKGEAMDKDKDKDKDKDQNGGLARGYSVIAWPAKYKDSGIMTFLMGKDGVVYQKDLGEKTNELAAAVAGFTPSEGWSVVLVPDSPNFPAQGRTAKK